MFSPDHEAWTAIADNPVVGTRKIELLELFEIDFPKELAAEIRLLVQTYDVSTRPYAFNTIKIESSCKNVNTEIISMLTELLGAEETLCVTKLWM